ncbi:phage tail protein [Aliivibrio finisterrensis]|uniref:Phage tail protein n=1 Tax=Aliivibrio finisterrensis TaxID=511998 RepID=A0A4Q5KAR1_9GAMM|nr:Ig-like domain-containing protein [Aliivibrio finisterrensis]RYU41895.1 phage tail protein [Aliivibrio finisterrensis]
MSEFLHGIRTIEQISGPLSVIEVSSSVIGVFGTSELAAPMEMYHTTNLDDAKKVFGKGSILDAIRRIHRYVPSNSIISFPLGKASDFPDVVVPETTGVTFSSSSASIYIDDGASSPVKVFNPKALTIAYASSAAAVATVDSATGVVTPLTEGSTVITATVTLPSEASDADAEEQPAKGRNAKVSAPSTETHTYTLTVAQTNPNAGLELSNAELSASEETAYIGMDTMPVSLTNPHGLIVVWSIDDETVALVDSASGMVSPLSAGPATVTATLMSSDTVAGIVLTYKLTLKEQDDKLLAAFMEALPLMRKAKQRFTFFPKINIAPGILHKPGAAGIAVGAISTIRGIWISDMPETVSTVEEAIAYKGQFTDKRLYSVWPRPKVLNEDGATVVDWYSPGMAGLIAQVDRNQTSQAIVSETGYWCSPSNYVMTDVIGPSIELEYVPNDPTSEVNRLNANGIATLMNHGGWKNFGNYSTSYPTTTDALNFLSWRRTMDIIEESIEDASRQFLDFPMFTSPSDIANTTAGRVRDTVNDYLLGKTGTALVYSSISIEKDDNPLSEIMKGNIKYRYKATPPVPMQTIEYAAVVYVEGLEIAMNQLF